MLQQNRTRIHSRIDLQRGEYCRCLTVGDGPMNRRGPAIARQQRRVQIDPAEARNCQEPRWNNLSVSDDHHRIGCDAFQEFLCRIRLDGFGLVDLQIVRECRFFDRRAADLLPASAWTVRLRDHSFDGNVWCSGETPERGYGEFRRATKDDAHGMLNFWRAVIPASA